MNRIALSLYRLVEFWGSVQVTRLHFSQVLTCITSITCHGQTYLWGDLFRSTAYGNVAYDEGLDVDANGNVYMAGWFSDGFDADPGSAFYPLSCTWENGYLLKLDPDGELLWALQIGSVDAMDTRVHCATATPDGGVVVGGRFGDSLDADPGPGVAMLYDPDIGAFATKFSASGAFEWAVDWGGAADLLERADRVLGLATDAAGNVFATGVYHTTMDLDPGLGSSMSLPPGTDAASFLVKLTSTGTYVDGWSWSAADRMEVHGIDVRDTTVALCGFHRGSVDLDPTSGTDPITVGVFDPGSFLISMSTSGQYAWGLALAGSSGGDRTVIGSAGQVWLTWGGGSLSRYAADGSLQWAGQFTSVTGAWGLAIDGNDNLWVGMHAFGPVDFDPGPGTQQSTGYMGNVDAYAVGLDPAGTLLWSGQWSWGGPQVAEAVAVDQQGHVFFAGIANGGEIDLDPTSGTDLRFPFGVNDPWLIKLDGTGPAGVHTLHGNELSVHPSPCRDHLILRSPTPATPSSLAIFSIDGRLVRSVSPARGEAMITLDTSDLAPGQYILHLKTDDTTYRAAFVRE